MVVDLIGIYGLKGPYRTLTMTDWFLQALSVIPMGSWGDVARRFTMIRWAGPYRTLTMTDWFLQALSVIPMGSWGDVARRFTMIRWAGLDDLKNCFSHHNIQLWKLSRSVRSDRRSELR
ncbi:UDP-glucosyltransferase [Dorcoceras hygrometricum]|uniref:UDP-glucosyltransferase n=1 Tax=Dorcoceras hygrometricum TaxID=472368 RepID=A0A2Z7AP17_9LAMI|nr:UDP-glucosyltransferase [Dorcoceras hygrometricum]